jgi:type II secretory pathway component PulF
MTAQALATFYRQLATMSAAGLSSTRALTVLTEQGTGAGRRQAGALLAVVRGGASLTDAMARHPATFPPLHVHLLAAGERSGKLDLLLNRLAAELEQGARLRGELLTRSLYPLLVLHLALLIRGVVLYFQGGLAPALTQVVLSFALLYGVALVLWVLWRLARRVPPLAVALDAVLYHTPVLHGILHARGTARFARLAEAMYLAGLPMAQTIETAALGTGNAVLRLRLLRAVPLIREGGHLAQALAATGAFSPLVNGLLHTGAESGRLDEMLRHVAEQSEHEAAVALERLGKVLPLVTYLLIMAFMAYLIVSILLGSDYFRMLNELTQ